MNPPESTPSCSRRSSIAASAGRSSEAGHMGLRGRGSDSTAAAAEGTAECEKTLSESVGVSLITWWNQKAGT